MQLSSALDDLKRVPLFAALPPDLLATVAAQARHREFHQHELMIHQGEIGHSLYVIAEGWVEVVYGWQAERGHGEVALGVLGPLSVVGELGVLTDYPRLASVVALEPVRCYEIPRAVVAPLLDQAHGFVRAFLNLLAERLQVADSRVAEEASDPLTGLPNRGILRNAYRRAAAAIQRTGGKLTVVLIDIDRLKAINDREGHHAGDAVLRLVAEALERTLRRMDLVVRYGGDEFAALLPGADAADAHGIMQRVRAYLDGLGEPAGKISFSYGIASLTCAPRETPPPLSDLLKMADDALYREKQLHHRQQGEA